MSTIYFLFSDKVNIVSCESLFDCRLQCGALLKPMDQVQSDK